MRIINKLVFFTSLAIFNFNYWLEAIKYDNLLNGWGIAIIFLIGNQIVIEEADKITEINIQCLSLLKSYRVFVWEMLEKENSEGEEYKISNGH